jgi:1-deoxy-D-xylulose-5-phosphate synthase
MAVPDREELLALRPAELDWLCADIRAFLVGSLATTGGHLGSNLGIVEITVALHRVFRSPHDVLLFDTGHQAYVHKLLTGRHDFSRLRRRGGLSGYPSRAESPHDVLENSHASVSLSYADGLAKAFALRGDPGRRVVAVIGDGALTGGVAWEALNNLGAAPQRPVVVVLNDNGRSYGPTAGAVAAHLRADRPGALFEALGLSYLGPVDGHDVEALEAALRTAAELRGSVVVHCRTTKGRGYLPAETDDRDRLHAVGPFDPAAGPAPAAGAPTWTQVFGRAMAELGARRPDVVAVTAAMLHPTGLDAFARAFPERTFDVGIAEQHAVASAAGLALAGLHPVVAVYATFLNRAFDQVLLDVALHRCPVTFALDRAGVTGDDGASHNGVWDLSALRLVPGVRIAAPRDGRRLGELLAEAVAVTSGPTVVRYPKGAVPPDLDPSRRVGEVEVLAERGSPEVLLVGVGPMSGVCAGAAGLLAAAGIGVRVVDPRWVVPVPPEVVALARGSRLVVSVEDGECTGGFAAALSGALRAAGVDVRFRALGVPARFLPHGAREEHLADLGLTAHGVAARVEGWVGEGRQGRTPRPAARAAQRTQCEEPAAFLPTGCAVPSGSGGT